jgi:uncharacterized tellurite resistance protein B-like protein
MIEETQDPQIEGDEPITESQDGSEIYDSKYLVAVALVFVAKGDGNISGPESGEMVELISSHFDIRRSQSLELLTTAIEDLAVNPGLKDLITELSNLLNDAEKEEIALMMLKVVAADGRKDAEEMSQLRLAADVIEIPAETLHRAFDRYFEETQA